MMEFPNQFPGDFNLEELFLNMSGGFNDSKSALEKIISSFKNKNPVFEPWFLNAIIVIYVILVVTGIISNTMVWLAVVLRAQMRTPRNFYVVNLTVSDIALCVISMPFTLIHFIQMEWNFGLVLCKLVPVVQGTNIFVSTGTIMAIALDRYLTIVRNYGPAQDKYRVLLAIALIWIVSCLLTCPIIFYQTLEEETFGEGVKFSHCIEKWPSPSLRALYTFGLLFFQVVIPISVLASVHFAIANHLRAHTITIVHGGEGKGKGGRGAKRSLLRYRRKKNSHKRLNESNVMMLQAGESGKCSGGGDNISTQSTLYNIPLRNEKYSPLGSHLSFNSSVGPLGDNESSGESKNGGEKICYDSIGSQDSNALHNNGTSNISKGDETTLKEEDNNARNIGESRVVEWGIHEESPRNPIKSQAQSQHRTPLNVKFKSNIGVCITFQEFCQLSTEKKAAHNNKQRELNDLGGSCNHGGSGGCDGIDNIGMNISIGNKSENHQDSSSNNGPLETVTMMTNRTNSSSSSSSPIVEKVKAGTGKSKTSGKNNDGKESTTNTGLRRREKENPGSMPHAESPGSRKFIVSQSHASLSPPSPSPAEGNTICCGHQMTASVVDPKSSVVTTTSKIPPTATATKRTKKELARNRRTTMILLSVAVTYTISWLPWHLLTLFADLNPNYTNTNILYTHIAICHIIAMTSALTNAVLYGWLNTNLRRELIKMFFSWAKR